MSKLSGKYSSLCLLFLLFSLTIISGRGEYYRRSTVRRCRAPSRVISLGLQQLREATGGIRISYPHSYVNAEKARFDTSSCTKFFLTPSDYGDGTFARFEQNTRTYSTGQYDWTSCNAEEQRPGVYHIFCPEISTLYVEHIRLFQGDSLISTTCVYVNGTFFDQMSVYMSTRRQVSQAQIDDHFQRVGIKVNSQQVIPQSNCDN